MIARPTDFVVTWQREGTPQTTYVAAEYVRALWRVVSRHPVGRKVLTATIAAGLCEALGITDFNPYRGGRFNWKYYSGSRRHYLRLWAALKVLQSLGVADHVVRASQSGVIRRVTAWDLQTELPGPAAPA